MKLKKINSIEDIQIGDLIECDLEYFLIVKFAKSGIYQNKYKRCYQNNYELCREQIPYKEFFCLNVQKSEMGYMAFFKDITYYKNVTNEDGN